MVTQHGSDVVFSVSRLRMAGLVLLGVAMTAACAFVLQRHLAPPGSFKEAAIMFGVPFFGLCTVIAIARLLKGGATLTIGPAGIRDTRVSPDLIPWRAITGFKEIEIHRQRMMMIEIDPACERALQLSRLTRMMGRANAALSLKGLAITAQGLDGSFDDLVAAVRKYRHRPPA